MKKRSLSKNRFLIYYQRCKPNMGKGIFMPMQNKSGHLCKKMPANTHAQTLGTL